MALVLCVYSAHHTHLIECIHFQSKSIHAWHAADHMEVRQLGCKVGLKGYITEILISYLWLAAVLEFQKKKITRFRKLEQLNCQVVVTRRRKVLSPPTLGRVRE